MAERRLKDVELHLAFKLYQKNADDFVICVYKQSYGIPAFRTKKTQKRYINTRFMAEDMEKSSSANWLLLLLTVSQDEIIK